MIVFDFNTKLFFLIASSIVNIGFCFFIVSFTLSNACLANFVDDAITAKIGCPWYSIFFDVNILSPLKIGPTSFWPSISFSVITSITPSEFKTSEKSILSIMPLLTGLKPIAACKRFLGSEISSV